MAHVEVVGDGVAVGRGTGAALSHVDDRSVLDVGAVRVERGDRPPEEVDGGCRGRIDQRIDDSHGHQVGRLEDPGLSGLE